jgi:phage host-nuclease inhibitor protein Gam
MGKTRQKKVLLPTTITKAEAEEAFAEFAQADARQQQLTSKMDEAITKIREKYATEITELSDKKEGAFEIMHAYAENNRDDFGKKKSMDLTHGTIGFRTGTPALKAAKGFTWKSITVLLDKNYKDFVRSVTEPAKDKILADRLKPEVKMMMDECGIIVDQAETFFVEPKKELVEA